MTPFRSCFTSLVFLALGSVSIGATTPAFIQEAHGQVSSGPTSSVAFPSSTSAGNLIVVYVIWDNINGASVSDTAGNTYLSAVGPTQWSGSQYNAQVFYATNPIGGADTVTATFANAVQSFGVIYVHEYSGVNQTGSPIDVTAAASGASAALNSGSATTTSANDLIFGAGVSDNVVTAAGSGFTTRDLAYGNITEDLIASTPGPNAATATHNGSMWAMQMVAFKAAIPPDTSAPTVPTGLSASAVSTSQINLSWNASTDANDTSNQLTYEVYRNGVLAASSTAGTTSWSDTGLAASTTYTYAVSAQDPSGNSSAQSASVQATTLSLALPAITSFNVTPASIVAGQTATLSWAVSNATSVTIDHGVGSVTGAASAAVNPTATTTYTLTAANNAGSITAQVTVTVSLGSTSSPSLVQVTQNQVASGTNVVVAFNNSTIPGNTIVAYVVWDNAGSVALTDSLGDVFASAGSPVSWGGGYSAQVFYASNIAGGADTVTAAFRSSVTSFGLIYIHEYASISALNPVDATAGASGASAALNSGSATTTSANDLIFGAGVSDNVVTAAGSGFIARDLDYGNITEDLIASAPGSYAATATHSGNMWAMQMVAFRAAGGTPIITGPTVPGNLTATTVSSSQINLSWGASTENGGVAGYHVYRNGVQIASTAALTFADTGLSPSTTYLYTVSAYDAAGNTSAQSAAASATTSGSSTQPPAVSITSPTNNQIVSGTVTIAANANDSVGVTGVQFKLDGANLGAVSAIAPYSTIWSTVQTGNGSHILTAVATDAAGNTTTSAAVAVTVNNVQPRPYTTNFPLTENPISEGGNWIDGKAVGVGWSDVSTTPGLAIGTQSGFNGYDDSMALLTGIWGPDQTVIATAHTVNQNASIFEEVEIRLRSTMIANSVTGYEVNFQCLATGGAYVQIVRWDGLPGNFTVLTAAAGPGLNDGDVVSATIIGNVITSYINGVAMASVTDNTYASGNPGMGFFLQGASGVDGDYGFTSFSATDGTAADNTPPSTPTNLTATAIASSRIDLSWTASTDNIGVAGYQVFRNNNQIGTTAATAMSDTGLSPNTQYSYAVAAFDAAGNVSAQSAPAFATTLPLETTAPPLPVGLQSSNITSSSVNLSWSEPAGSVPAAGYLIYRNGTQVAATTSTSYGDTGLAASTTYTYTVAAYGYSNLASGQSQQLLVTTSAAPQTSPSLVQVTQNQIASGGSVSVDLNIAATPGNTIVVYVVWDNAGSAALTDSLGDVFVSVGSPVTWSSGYSAQVFYASNIAGGADTITAAFRSSVSTFGLIYVHEYTGISATNPVDVTAAASGSLALLNSGSATTTSPNDLIFGAGVSDNVVTAAGAGFIARDLAYGNITEDLIAATPGSYAATAAHNGNTWAMQMVAFRAAQ